MSFQRTIIISVSIAILALLVFIGSLFLWHNTGGGKVTPYGGDFSLLHMSGENKRLSQLPGQYKLLYFGYTSCPDICPLALSNIVLALQIVPQAQRERVQPVFISIDPERDTPQAVKAYMELYTTDNISFEGYSGTPESTYEVVHDRYGLFYEKDIDPRYTEYIMNHPSLFLLVDNKGRLIPGGIIHDRAELGAHRSLARDLSSVLETL